jgi:hypothetical protein
MPISKPIGRLPALASVLSQTRDVICDVHGISEADAFKRTQEFINDNSERWRLEEPNVNYSDPFCRMAYLYMNVAVHASLIEQAFSSYRDLKDLIVRKAESGSDLQICVLGGGPGSELLGIVRYIQRLNLSRPTHLDLVLVDRIKEWDESWHALKTGIDQQLKISYGDDRGCWPVTISRSFLPLDVTSETDFAHFATRFGQIHLFLVSYLVSELKSSLTNLENVIALLVERSSPEAMILFIDRDERHIREAVDHLISQNRSLRSLGLIEVRGRLEDDLRDLGEWYINLPSLPRQRWLAFFHLAKRVN